MSRAALELEALKLARATAARVAALAVVLGVPGLAAGFVAVATGEADSPMALKVRLMLVGTGWDAYLGLVAQVLSVGALLAAGVVAGWCFGREHTDGTFAALVTTPTRPRAVALAKHVALAAWGAAVTVAALVVALALGGPAGVGAPGADTVGPALRVLAVGLLAVALAAPLTWVASATRGYLAAFGALLGLVVLTQVVTVAGAGAWFPYAAPGLWAGLGGAAQQGVTVPQLLLPLVVGALGVAASAAWWERAEAR